MKNVAVFHNDLVVAINVVNDDYAPQPNEREVHGVAWVGGDYAEGLFYPPRPYPSWTRDNGNWKPPVPQPPGELWRWDETGQQWEQTDG